MTDADLEDHAVGVELQLVELVEQRERAVTQGRVADAAALKEQIDGLHDELARTADLLTGDD